MPVNMEAINWVMRQRIFSVICIVFFGFHSPGINLEIMMLVFLRYTLRAQALQNLLRCPGVAKVLCGFETVGPGHMRITGI